MDQQAELLQPPYYLVSFYSLRQDGDDGYEDMAKRMEELASQQNGYLGMESVRDSQGLGITLSYWQDINSIQQWKQQLEHQQAQLLGREKWYQWYRVEVARVEYSYQFSRDER